MWAGGRPYWRTVVAMPMQKECEANFLALRPHSIMAFLRTAVNWYLDK